MLPWTSFIFRKYWIVSAVHYDSLTFEFQFHVALINSQFKTEMEGNDLHEKFYKNGSSIKDISLIDVWDIS